MSAYLLVLFLAFASASITKRQLPETGCSLTELTEKLQGFEEGCRSSTVGFTLIDPEDYVERQEEVFAALQVVCSPDCFVSVSDLVLACYPSFRIPLGQACGSNGAIPCWQGPIINNGTELALNCESTISSNFETCSDDCQESITEIRSTLGCCVNNVFNTTVFGSELADLQVANGRLWDVCDIERIDFCPLPDAFVTDVGKRVSGSGGLQIAVLMLWLLFSKGYIY